MLVLAAAGGGSGLSAADWATIIAGLVAGLALADYARSVWHRTAGRRRDVARRLTRLGNGAQVQFFESVLGEPPAMRRRFDIEEEDWSAVENDEIDPPLVTRTYLECFWIDRDYCVQTISDQDDSVVGYSITTRNRRFRPTIHFPLPPTGRERLMQVLTLGRRRPYELARVKLGHTTRRLTAAPADSHHLALRQRARGAGRPRAQATRSSSASGDSGDGFRSGGVPMPPIEVLA